MRSGSASGIRFGNFFVANDEIAAWLQAIGGLLAILASWLFARAEGKRATEELNEIRRMDAAARAREDKDADEALQSNYLSAFVLLSLGHRKVADFANLIRNHPADVLRVCRLGAGDLESVSRQLERFQLPSLASPEPINITASAALLISKLRNQLVDISSWAEPAPDLRDALAAAALKGSEVAEAEMMKMRDLFNDEILSRWPGLAEGFGRAEGAAQNGK
jgi:hypothetical protein